MEVQMSRARKLLPLLVIAVLAIAAVLYFRQSRKPRELILAGTLEARSVNVGSLVGGRVVRVHVDEGSAVAPAQPIVTLDPETVDRQIAEQRAAIEAARAGLAKAVAGPRPDEIQKAAAIAENDEADRRRMSA